MKRKLAILNRALSFMLCLMLVVSALPVTARAEENATSNTETIVTVSDNDAETVTEEVSSEEVLEDAAAETTEESVIESVATTEYDIWELDWENASDEEIQTYLDNTDLETTGRWFTSLSEDAQAALLEKDTILNKETSAVYYDAAEETVDGEEVISLEETGETFTGTYAEVAVKEYEMVKDTVKATYFGNKSGYYNYKFVKGSESVLYRFTVSGIDTTKAVTTKQTITVACTRKEGTAISGVNFWSNGGNYNANGYTTKALTVKFGSSDAEAKYTHVNNRFGFTKPLGYTVVLSYENKNNSFMGHAYYANYNGYTFDSDNRVRFTADTTADTAVALDLVSQTSLTNNSTVGTSSSAGTAMTYVFTFTPSTYTVNYNGNGATSGSVASQVCTYDTSYLHPANGFTREYTVNYNGNGGVADEASVTKSYTFSGWSDNPAAASGVPVGSSFINGATSGIVNVYATWGSIPTVTLPKANRTGYQFQGWATSAIGAAAYNTATPYPVTANTTLYAAWKPNTYTVTYNTDGGTECANTDATYGTAFTLPSTTRDGYIFKGWTGATLNKASALSSVSNLTAENNATVVLTAEWDACIDTPYKVVHRGQADKNDEKYDVILAEEEFQGESGSTVSVGCKTFEGYTCATTIQTVTIAADGSTVVTFYYDKEEKNTIDVPVYHYIRTTVNGNYELIKRDLKTAQEVGVVITPELCQEAIEAVNAIKNCECVVPSTQTVTVQEDTVVNYYYDIKVVAADVEINHHVKTSVDGDYELFEKETKESVTLGSVLVPELCQEAIDAVNAAMKNYSCVVPAVRTTVVQEGLIIDYYYDIEQTAEDVVVNHRIKTSVGGKYQLFATETMESVELGTVISPELSQDAINAVNAIKNCGCVKPTVKAVTVKAGTVIDYYYDIDQTAEDVVINHYIKKNLDGKFELFHTETKKSMKLGTVITPALYQKAVDTVNSVKNCKCVVPSTQTVTVEAGTKVDYYYDIEKDEVGILVEKIVAGDPVNIENNDIDYNVVKDADGTFIIKSINTTTEKLVIPDVFQVGDNIYKVSKISDKAFVNNTTLKEVVVSGNIHTIGTSAFEGCKNLKKITLKSGISKIGAKAFKGCTSLTSIKIPGTVQSIGNNAFENCTKLKTVTLNKGLLTIGNNAFLKCKALTKITIPASVLKIGTSAFKDCAKLKTVSFKSGSELMSMGTGVFLNCKALTKITIPGKLSSIPQKAFYNCTKLKTVTIGKNVTSIGASAFSGTAIEKITIPAKVQTIGKQAFYKCGKLKKVSIKSTVLTSVGSQAFKKCHKSIKFGLPKSKIEDYKKLFKGKI